jgi:branched-chain amino acid transport system ATP-binding protein
MSVALEIKNVHHAFGQTQVLCNINLVVNAGERVALIGPNGAGKSTLFNLISGRMVPSRGQIFLNGARIDGKAPHDIYRTGLSRSFQITNLFSKLSVQDNLRCALLWRLGYGYRLFQSLAKRHDVNERAASLLQLIGLERERNELAMNLSYANQRALEVGITIAGDSPVVLLDEPTSGMSGAEAQQFMQLIRSATQNKTLLLIEHDMSVVFGVAEKIAVMAHGEMIAFDTPAAIRANAQVQEAYLGTVVKRNE